MQNKLFSLLGLFLFSLFSLNADPGPIALRDQQSGVFELKEVNDLAYHSKDANADDLKKLNLILPKSAKNPPILLWIGGGAWAYVDRNKEMALCRKMAKQGIAVASVGHRLSPALLFEPFRESGIKHPEHVKDVAEAFKWIYDNADKYNYSKENIFVGGFSSGAHLSALLSMDERYLKEYGLTKEHIKAIIPVGGGYDIPHYREDMLKEDPAYDKTHFYPVFGSTEAEWIDASPTNFIANASVPILMLSENYTYSFTKLFEEKLVESGFQNFDVIHVHKLDHAGLWLNLTKAEHSIYRNIIVDYIKTASKEKASP